MKLGIAGLPNVGKSTLFNALTKAGAQAANYPFCTIDPNVGIVPVPDKRLDVLAEMYNPEKLTPATIEFVDIAGLVRGASKGEGLGNRFLAHIREVDAIVHVVRCFEDDNITHVDGTVAPVRDMETIQMEFVLADLEVLQKRFDKASKLIKTGDKKYKEECAVLQKLLDHMQDGAPALYAGFDRGRKRNCKRIFPFNAKAHHLCGQCGRRCLTRCGKQCVGGAGETSSCQRRGRSGCGVR